MGRHEGVAFEVVVEVGDGPVLNFEEAGPVSKLFPNLGENLPAHCILTVEAFHSDVVDLVSLNCIVILQINQTLPIIVNQIKLDICLHPHRQTHVHLHRVPPTHKRRHVSLVFPPLGLDLIQPLLNVRPPVYIRPKIRKMVHHGQLKLVL